MSPYRTIKIAPGQDSIREALSRYRAWIESKLRVPWSSAVSIQTGLPICQVAVRRLLAFRTQPEEAFKLNSVLLPRIQALEIPGSVQPSVSADQDPFDFWRGEGVYKPRENALEWLDVPVLVRIRGFQASFVALQVPYIATFESHKQEWQNLIVAPRHLLADVMDLLRDLSAKQEGPQLIVQHGGGSLVTPCHWEDLVFDDAVIRLLKDDLTTFFRREDWFKRNRLPHRRGYLLWGPPGCGKSSALRALLWTQRLDGYTLRWFDRYTTDADLDNLFFKAHANRPSVVVMEDIDRAFPRTGLGCGLSLQTLLNCLDGVATGDGIITVATANAPMNLDPAILKRPGRFDRVIHFANPDAGLRLRYMWKLNPALKPEDLNHVVGESDGYSYAQLREAFIIGGQMAFEREDDITAVDLLQGIRALRTTTDRAARAFT
jgi:hypothetical protein